MAVITTSYAVFACHSKACAPPPAGHGGSNGGAGSKVRSFTQNVGKSGSSATHDAEAERIYAAHMKPIRDYIARPPVHQPNMTPYQLSARRMAVVGIPRSTGRAKALTRKQAARSRVLGGKWNVPKMKPYRKQAEAWKALKSA